MSEDPLGRRALFGPPGAAGPAPGPDGRTGRPGPARPAAGRRAFFSGAPTSASGTSEHPGPPGSPGGSAPGAVRGRPLAVLDCARCGTRSPLGLRGTAAAVIPSVWLPLLALVGRRHDRWARCPACGHWAWCRVGAAGR